VCRFCSRNDASATFKKVAHTVGASFGNRHHFTNEECDDCNENNGPLDDALAHYLAAERITIGVRKREGFPKLKGRDGTSMQYDGDQQRLTFVTDSKRPTEAEVRYKILSTNEFEVTVPRPAFSYDDVVRNLVRLTWMLLPTENLAESPEYLQLVLGRARPEKWEIFRLFVPDAPHEVRFQIWRARDGLSATIPRTVTAFTVGYLTTVWASSDGTQPMHCPGPLPPFEVDARFGEPSMQWLAISPGTFEEPGTQTLTFGCTEIREGSFADERPKPQQAKKSPRPRWPVEFRWTSTDTEQRLKSLVHVQRPDLSRPRLLFSGGDFAATLLVDGHNSKSARCELDLLLCGATTIDALRTLDLLQAMQDASRGASVHTEDGTVWQIAGLQPPPALDLELVRRRVGELHDVSSACGAELRVPRGDDARAWTLSALISSAIRNQGVVVVRRRRTVSILIPLSQAAALDKDSLAKPGPLSIPCLDSWSIGGVELDIGNVSLHMPDAQLVARELAEGNGEIMERLKFVGDVHSYRFERWLEADTVSQSTPADS
jgi:hypothetical protein